MADETPHITVDFNNSDEDGLIFARVVRASAPLSEGEQVVATDDEGHECRASVARLEGELVYLALDTDTWTVDERATGSPLSVWHSFPAVVIGNGSGSHTGNAGDVELSHG